MMQTEKEIRENLNDAGVSGMEAESILACIRTGNMKAAEKLIGKSRKKQLERIHESQQCIDRLDYLNYQLTKRN